MATKEQMNQLSQLSTDIESIDMDKLLRPSLGVESLQTVIGPKIDEVKKKLNFAIEIVPSVHTDFVPPVIQVFQNIKSILSAHANRNNTDYVAQKNTLLTNLDGYLIELQKHWSPFVVATVEARGFLEDQGIRLEYQRTIESMKQESAAALELVKQEAAKTIDEARKLAQQIEDRARRTAAHISVESAQEQFREAQTYHKSQVKTWAWITVIPVVIFLIATLYFYNEHLIPVFTTKNIKELNDFNIENSKWIIIYKSVMRLTILTALGAIATFCLRIFRANLHMFQHNLHRQRITNSMSAFVESAVTPEQRDLILTHLVDSVSNFGMSGLLQNEDDSIHPSRMTIDTIARTFAPQTPKS